MGKHCLSLLFVLSTLYVSSQNYTILGNSTPYSGCNSFLITPDDNDKAGAIYQNQTINLNNSFDYTFNVFLGCGGSGGADGICFVLTSNPNGLGNPGEGLGYAGGNQPYSLAVEFDTWQNGAPANDPAYDHIGIESGGQYSHNVAPAVPALASQGNIDNCATHIVRIVWDVNTGTFSVYFDGALRQQFVNPNLVNTYFGGNPVVNWGWSGATGGGTNEQRVQIVSTSNWVGGINYQSCNTTMQFSDISTSNLGAVQSWAWNFGDGGTSTAQNPSHTYATTGTYTVTLTITDITSCANTFSHTVTINPPIALTPATTAPLCNGALTGTVALTTTGGFGPSAGYGGYRYTWNNGTTQPTLSGVGAGTYLVTVTDGVCTTTAQYTINQPTALTATTSHTDAPCGGNGTVTIAGNGGTPPYTASWAGFPGFTVSLPPGTWIADIHDSRGCSALLQYTQTITQLPCGYNLSASSTNVTCYNGSNGTATVSASGGSGNFSYAWSNTGNTATIIGLQAGIYNYTVTDLGNSQIFTGSVSVTQPGAGISASIATVNMSCANSNDGQALASVTSGGVAPFNYAWSRGTVSGAVSSGLSPGPISVVITDANGCTASAAGNITGPPILTLNVTSVDDSCYQSELGSATANAGGGNPPYLYYWSNISSAQTNLSLGIGTYTVTVTDNKGCTITGSASINQPAPFTHTLTSQNIACFGNTTGSITVTPTGGIPALTYTWNPATAVGSNPTNLAGGQYNLTLSDAHNCRILDSVVITAPASALTVTTSHTNATCFGANDGSLTIIVAGGTPPYQYGPIPVPPGTTTIPGLPDSTYSGNITDANGCSVAVSETITEPAALSLTETHVNELCNGGTSGSIDVTVTGGSPPYTYLWNDGASTQDRSNMAAGTYILTCPATGTCTASLTVNITQPTAVSATETHVNVSCNGASTGSINITPAGGTGPYTYLWNDAVQTQNRTAIPAATYSVTITDANLCAFSMSITVSQPAALSVITSHTNVTCNGANNGTLTINVSGGTPPYNFGGFPVPPGITVIPGLPDSTYSGSITDANGCSFPVSETITEPAAVSIAETHINILCNGLSTGSIDITPSGGTLPFTYLWNDGVNTQDRTGIPAGVYSVRVTDGQFCFDSIVITLTEPTAFTATEAHVNVSCNGGNTGSINITPAGGIGPYTYLWNDAVVTQNRLSIPAGAYAVTVTDANLCTIGLSITLTQPAALSVTTSHTNVTCNGANDGTLTINVGGGTPPYNYGGFPVPSGTTVIPGLPDSTYAGNISDANGCSVAVSETITEPGPQSLTMSNTNETCNGGITATASALFINPTGAVVYNWTGGLTGSNITGLSAGVYAVTATDANACALTDSVTITEPPAPLMTVTAVDAICFGGTGSATANPTGAGPFTYTWSAGGTGQTISPPAGTYSVSASDVNSCNQVASFTINQPTEINTGETHTDLLCFGDANGSITLTPTGGTGTNYTFVWSPNVSTTNSAALLTAGNYYVSVTDQAGCVKSDTIILTQPALPLSLNIQSNNITCFGLNNGSITCTATGGTPGYQYTWSPNVSTNDSASGLSPNTYSITVSDINSCSVVSSVTLSQPNQPLAVTTDSTNLTCFQSNDGTATVTATGGTFPYVYSWNPNVSTTNSATGLAAGVYAVTVTDNNSCTNSAAFNLIQPAQLNVSETHIDVLCNGTATGSILISASGGTPGYSYNWSPNVSTTDSAVGISAGNYSVTISDANNCMAIQAASISEPLPLTLSPVATDVLCNGGNTGTIVSTPGGGVPSYSFSATDGVNNYSSSTGIFNSLYAGTYSITVQDQNQCTASGTAVIQEPAILSEITDTFPVLCYNSSDGRILVSILSGGVSPFTYNLSNGASNTTGIFNGLAAGDYRVTIIDANGCATYDSATITEPDPVLVEVLPTPIEVKLGESLQITTTTNQSGILTYDWSPKFGLSCYDCADPVFTGVYSQPYLLTVTNQNGCPGTANFMVTVVPDYSVFIPNVFTPNGDGPNDYWQIFGNMPAFKQMEVKVFDRWGEKVFESHDINFKWDGTYKGAKVPPAVYVYVAKFVWLNNHSDSDYKGSITVLY